MKMSTRNFSSVFVFLLVICAIRSCRAQNQSVCVPSSCGNILDISYPFRLKADPKNCGMRGFELDCQNNRTIVSFKSKIFYVQAISYDNYTIRLIDPVLEKNNFCLSPNHTIDSNDIYNGDYFEYVAYRPGKVENEFINLNVDVVFVNCLVPVNSARYINTTFCSKGNETFASTSSKNYSYVILGDDIPVSEFDESCNVEKIGWSSVQGPIAAANASLSDIYAGLTYGFELSWYRVVCQACLSRYGSDCIVLDTVFTCRHNCYESTPLDERDFSCLMEYYGIFILAYGGIGIAALVALRFIFGLPLLIGVACYQWKRRHLSVDWNSEDFLQAQDNQCD